MEFKQGTPFVDGQEWHVAAKHGDKIVWQGNMSKWAAPDEVRAYCMAIVRANPMLNITSFILERW